MKRFAVVVIAVLLAGVTSAQPPTRTKTSRDASRLRAIEQGLARAYVNRDRGFVDRVLADDWKVTDAGGRVLDKAQVLRETFESKDRRIEAARIDQVRVRVYGDSALVTGRSWAKGSYRGTTVSATFLFTDVFARRNGQWRVVASQATLLGQ